MESNHTKGKWEILYKMDFQHKPFVDSIRVKRWHDNDLMGDYQGCLIADFTLSHGDREHAYKEAEYNALHILKCVNHYDELVSALEKVVRFFDKHIQASDDKYESAMVLQCKSILSKIKYNHQ